jgi:Flp pilus assembly protein TadD
MFLTHLDEEGNDSPAILIDNATAANRAVNIPEFVNIPPDGMMKIDVPAAESYRLFDVASELTAKGRLEEAIAVWKKVLEMDPRNAQAQSNLGVALLWQGNLAEGMTRMQKAMEIDPNFSLAQSNFGIEFYYREQFRAAVQKSDCDGATSYGNKILAVAPDDAEVKKALADCAPKQNRRQMRTALQKSDWQAALSYASQILALEPGDEEARKAVKDRTLAVSRRAVQ